jgi:EmrB/QacA subfamily drug resistance transporter
MNEHAAPSVYPLRVEREPAGVPDAATADAAGTRRGMSPKAMWALAITSIAVFMVTLDNLVVTTAIPVLREDLNASLSGLQWTVNAYTLTFAVLLLTGAALGDRFGRRRLLVIGIAIFTVASAAAALAPSILALDVARAAQGLGGAIVMPLTLTILSASVPAERRGVALGIWGGISGLAVALGPLVGGAIVSGISWHWIFWLNVPIGLVLVPLILLRLDESRGPASRLDLPGLALASTGLVGIVWGLVRANEAGWTSAGILGSFFIGAALLGCFVAWELRTEHPMLPMRFFRNRTFALANVASLLMFFGMFGAIFFISQFFQTVQGLSPFQSGLRILPWTAMPMLVAPIAGALSDRIGGHRLMGAGLALQAIGLAWIASVSTPTTPYLEFVGPFLISGVGMALFFAPVAHVVLSSVRPEQEGQASGANNAIRELGGVFGVAVLAAVFTVNGGYGSGQQFVDGMNPAVTIGAALVAVGAVAAFAIKRSPRAEPLAAVAEVPFVTACACASCWCAPPADTPETEDHDVGAVKIPVLVGAT